MAEVENGYLALPRGCVDEIVLDDKRKCGIPLKGLVFAGELRKEQKKAVAELSRYDCSMLYAPTAFGKTVTNLMNSSRLYG